MIIMYIIYLICLPSLSSSIKKVKLKYRCLLTNFKIKVKTCVKINQAKFCSSNQN